MVTAQATKAALDEGEMVAELAQISPEFDREPICGPGRDACALVDARLVRSLQQGERSLFEPAHDRMVDVIRTWISDEEMAAKAVRELLRREWTPGSVSSFSLRRSLRLIDEQREALR